MRMILFILVLLITATGNTQEIKDLEQKRLMLPNGWSLTPAGTSMLLGDLPLNIAVSKSKRYIAVTNNGQSTQSIQLIDTKKQLELDQITIAKSWYGLVFSNDEQYLYASGGHDNRILKYGIGSKKLVLEDSMILGAKWPNRISPSGMALDDDKQILYVTTKEDNSLYIVDLQTKKSDKLSLGAEAYTCLLSKNRKTLYISLWGGDKVLLMDTETRTITSQVAVGDNPNEMCLSNNQRFLFVANANDNSVSVIDVDKKVVLETLNAALYPDAPSGSTSNGVALSENGKTLYVANADNNCLAVFDVAVPGQSKSKGFIPTGWYPTNVKVIGKKIYVSNGKGFSSMANPNGPSPYKSRQSVTYQQGDLSKPVGVQYIAGLFKGEMSIIDEPKPADLAIYSQLVYKNTPYTKDKETNAGGETGNPVPMRVGDESPIKYVFYIIKENRTYDQVLGDMKNGNGDTSLLLFGQKVTPNQHALVDNFVLLDNFYVDAEVSADGHNWSMGAYATDYLEKTWPSSYGGRGGRYDGEGNRAIANNKAGFIWDHCKKYNVSYRTYGEFADAGKANIPSLKGHFCNYYDGFDTGIRDTVRFRQWQLDFDSLLAIDRVPNLNTVRFGNDHTDGMRKGKPTPFAHVADNDLAVGMFIDHLSHSSIWNQSVVFILEDDAQNGPDHVDAHRSPCYVVGPHVKRSFVDHGMYSTSSVLRTMELILGMPPMTQYDAAANPMWRCFTTNANNAPYNVLPINVNLNDKNTGTTAMSILSEKFDWTKEDKVPDLIFNEILWKGIKGMDARVPAPSRAAFVKLGEKKDDDDD